MRGELVIVDPHPVDDDLRKQMFDAANSMDKSDEVIKINPFDIPEYCK